MGKAFKKLDPVAVEKAKEKAVKLEAFSSKEIPRELLDKVAGGDDDEIPVGRCPRCGSTLYVACEEGGLFYFCKDCHYYYLDMDFFDDYY